MPSRPVLIGRRLATTNPQHTSTNPIRVARTTYRSMICRVHTYQETNPVPGTTSSYGSVVHRVTAAIAAGKHPVPSRTRKLSLPAPMVLQPRGCGRVGRRRTYIRQRASRNAGPLVVLGVFAPSCCLSGRRVSTGVVLGAVLHSWSCTQASLSDLGRRLVPSISEEESDGTECGAPGRPAER